MARKGKRASILVRDTRHVGLENLYTLIHIQALMVRHMVCILYTSTAADGHGQGRTFEQDPGCRGQAQAGRLDNRAERTWRPRSVQACCPAPSRHNRHGCPRNPDRDAALYIPAGGMGM